MVKGAAKKAKMREKRNLFPQLDLPLPIPFAPMEAEVTEEIPKGDYQFEPKWDGFRAIVFRKNDDVVVQSKSGQPLGRYFPEIVDAILKLKAREFVIDGELVIQNGGKLSFDDLQLRLHPAESRIRRLASEIPAQYFVFDILYEPKPRGSGKLLVEEPLRVRREHLLKFFEKYVRNEETVKLSPATTDRKVAQQWFDHYGPLGLDGVMAKPLDEPYHSGDRKGMLKVKHFRTADCVVGGFRYYAGSRAIAGLALGLYDEDGILQHVGNASGFNDAMKKELEKLLEPMAGGAGFGGKSPGQSRWSSGASEFVPVDPKLVCEVRYDYFTSERFRHATRFLRWRLDKSAESCTFDQLVERQKPKKKIAFPF